MKIMYPPVFYTSRFTLKPYAAEDADRFVEISLDSVSTRFMGGSTGSEHEERRLFNKILQVYEQKDKRWFWIWGIYKDDLLCGHLEMKESAHTTDNELELVYMVHPNERRKGVMTEVMSFMKEKQHSWQRRIIATVSPENTNSILLLNKWGIAKKELLLNDETGKKYLKLTLTE